MIFKITWAVLIFCVLNGCNSNSETAATSDEAGSSSKESALKTAEKTPEKYEENPDGIVPRNTIKGLDKYVGKPVSRVTSSFPIQISTLKFPDFKAYMGMTKKNKKEDLAFHLGTVIYGVPDTQSILNDRYAIFSACRRNSCDEKAWFMIDVQTENYLAAILHLMWEEEPWTAKPSLLLFSDTFKNLEDIPAPYIQALQSWAESKHAQYSNVRFIGPDANLETVCSECSTQLLRGPN